MSIQRRGSRLLAEGMWRNLLQGWVLDVGLEGWGEFSRQILGCRESRGV